MKTTKASAARCTLFTTILIALAWLSGFQQVSAQNKSTIQLGITTGMLPLSTRDENIGLFLKVEPKIKVLKNTFFGLRFGLTINAQRFENTNSGRFLILEEGEHAVIAIIPNVDYYFKEAQSEARPYLGLGVGAYLLSDLDVFTVPKGGSAGNTSILSLDRQIGVLFRGGIAFNRLRLGLEYNFIPSVSLSMTDDQPVGTVASSYLGLSVGYIFGLW